MRNRLSFHFYEKCEAGGYWVPGFHCPIGELFWNALECCVPKEKFPCKLNCRKD